MCVIYSWALGFSPHEDHLQICSMNVLTGPVNQVKSPCEDQSVALKSNHLEALGKLLEYITKKAKYPKLVFRQPASPLQNLKSTKFYNIFQKSDQGYLTPHIKRQLLSYSFFPA